MPNSAEHPKNSECPRAADRRPLGGHGALQSLAEAGARQPAQTGIAVLAGGGPGAGKSTVLGDKHSWAGRADAVWDGTLAWYPRTKEMVQMALDSGRQVEINFIHRPFNLAWDGVLIRANDEGRTVPLRVAAEKHAQAVDAIRRLHQDFGERITIKVYRNARGIGEHETISLEQLYDETYNANHETEASRNTNGAPLRGSSKYDEGRKGHGVRRAGEAELPTRQRSEGAWRDLAARWYDSGVVATKRALAEGRISRATAEALIGKEALEAK